MRGPVYESPRTRCGVQEKGRRGIHLPVLLDTASQRSMTRWRGPVRPQRERAEQTPPLSGREEANRPRKKGEDCLSTASSAAPEGGDSLRAKKPDNSGGASWFVLLAVEKNEHTVSPRTTMRGPGKGKARHSFASTPRYRVAAQYDEVAGSSEAAKGKGGANPAFIGPGGGQSTEEEGRGLFEHSEFRSPRGR